MKSILSSFFIIYIKYFFFWVFFSIVIRTLFILYHWHDYSSINRGEIVQTFIYGGYLDRSLSAYFCIIPFLLFPICIYKNKVASLFISLYTYIILIPACILVAADLELYKHWEFRTEISIIDSLKTPAEAYASSLTSPLFLLFFIIFLLLFVNIFIYKKFIQKDILAIKPIISKKINYTICITGLFFFIFLIIPIRGGLQLAPINQSIAYFSTNTFLNHASINVLWNFLASIYEKNMQKKIAPRLLDDSIAKKSIYLLFQQKGYTENIIKKEVPHPNIVLIIWESFTAKSVKSLGGENLTPAFDVLSKEGILFDSIYAAGSRTHFGIMGILGSYPTIHEYNIFNFPRKTAKLPCLAKDFYSAGYTTHFYYGGELEFANMQNYIVTGGFQNIISKNDFSVSDRTNNKWGAFDHIVFEKVLKDMETIPTPFFITVLTLSSHEPFELPDEKKWHKPNTTNSSIPDSLFAYSLYYADKAISEFIRSLQEKKLWDNTLIIIIADHGSRLFSERDEIKNFHIPMLWLGGVLTKQDIVIQKLASQTDMAPTLLAQLGFPFTHFYWGKNIMNSEYKPFAYFNFQNGFGFLQPGVKYIFDTEGMYIRSHTGKVDSNALNLGKSYFQNSLQDYLTKENQ